MILSSLILLASLSSGAPARADSATSIHRIVVVLGERDPGSSSRVLQRLKACTDGTPTAVVSAFGELRIEQDFATETGFTLAAHVPPASGKAQGVAASLQLLAEALAPVGSTTAVVVVAPRVGANPGMGVTSPSQPSVDGAQSSSVEFYGTVEIPASVRKARKALREAELTVVAVNTDRTYDAGAKALTEIPRGRYLQTSQGDFGKALLSAVCGAGR
jgi:hypothetical protein